jgi:hypothetical protein
MECNCTSPTLTDILMRASNPPWKTIEAEVYDAFAKAGAILQANAQDPVKARHLFYIPTDGKRAVSRGQPERTREYMLLETSSPSSLCLQKTWSKKSIAFSLLKSVSGASNAPTTLSTAISIATHEYTNTSSPAIVFSPRSPAAPQPPVLLSLNHRIAPPNQKIHFGIPSLTRIISHFYDDTQPTKRSPP